MASTNMDMQKLFQQIDALNNVLDKQDTERVKASLRCVQTLLKIDEYRLPFLQNGGIECLKILLYKYKTNHQFQYQIIFCLWCLSFNAQVCVELIKKGVVNKLGVVLSEAFLPKEKIVRIALATIRNLFQQFEARNNKFGVHQLSLQIMTQCKILSDSQFLKRFEDSDLQEDAKYLHNKLRPLVQDFNSLDEYSLELRSGSLLWSAMHKSDKFWKENANKFDDNGYELIRLLINILKTSRDALVLSIAAHDLSKKKCSLNFDSVPIQGVTDSKLDMVQQQQIFVNSGASSHYPAYPPGFFNRQSLMQVPSEPLSMQQLHGMIAPRIVYVPSPNHTFQSGYLQQTYGQEHFVGNQQELNTQSFNMMGSATHEVISSTLYTHNGIPQTAIGAVPASVLYAQIQMQNQPMSNSASQIVQENDSNEKRNDTHARIKSKPMSKLPPHWHPRYKTEMCNKYTSEVGCPFGKECQYLHPEDLGSGDTRMRLPCNNSGRMDFTRKDDVRYMQKKQIEGTLAQQISRENHQSGINQHRFITSHSSKRSSYGSGNNTFVRPVPGVITPAIHPKFKTIVCNKYNSPDGCPYGAHCQFRHPEDHDPPHLMFQKFSQMSVKFPMGHRDGFNRESRLPSAKVKERNFVHQTVNNDNGTTIKRCSSPLIFLNEHTLPKFVKAASKPPRNGLRRHNSSENLGHYTFMQVALLKNHLKSRKKKELAAK
ncbi:v-ATPase subunit H domain-containing protein [Ditylenchus destructor]|uniref:V-ATPase subunit H domain-containing protein n=1 Tax=Ditylenchus destructor TaxID=166010 RepID=A0AAD4MIV7_9BILA|nr:v-ATPase subunit H domain-containing protein [Ditylenchus destructor]